jgi:hypothetical protein
MTTRCLVLQVIQPKVKADGKYWQILVGYPVKKYGRILMEKTWIFGVERPELHTWVDVVIL